MMMTKEQEKIFEELIDVAARLAPKKESFNGKEFKDYLLVLSLFAMVSLSFIASVLKIQPNTPTFDEFIRAIRQDLTLKLTQANETVRSLMGKIKSRQL